MADSYKVSHLQPWAPAVYQIKVEGLLNKSWSEQFGGMRIEVIERKDQSFVTTLTGRLVDQSELTGVLNGLTELHLAILSVECISFESVKTEDS